MAAFKKYEDKNGNERWSFQVYLGVNPVTGKKIRTTRRGFKYKKEAQLALNRLQVDFEQKGLQHPQRMTYQQAYDGWLTEYVNTVRESTLVKTKGYFKNHILPAFGQLRIDKITVPYTQSVVNDWAKSMTKYKTILNYASAVFQYAIKLDLIQKDPTKFVVRPAIKQTVNKDNWVNFYDKNELKHFLSCLADEDKQHGNHQANTLFRLLAFTGIRKGEALALTWNDIDFTKHTLNINKALTRGENARLYVHFPKTVNSVRLLDIDAETCKILRKWQLYQREYLLMLGYNVKSNDEQLIFSNSKNTFLQPSKIRKWLNHVINKYDLKYITVHGLRHTHASLLFEAGATIKEVQDRLGHSDVKTTMDIYTHVSKYARKETASKFAQYVDAN